MKRRGRLNHQINSQNSLMLRYAYTNTREAGDDFNTIALEDASAHGSEFITDDALSARSSPYSVALA